MKKTYTLQRASQVINHIPRPTLISKTGILGGHDTRKKKDAFISKIGFPCQGQWLLSLIILELDRKIVSCEQFILLL